MLPSADRLLEGLQFFVRRQGLDVQFERSLLVDALAHAEQLAAGEECDEPAALFYACSCRPRAFGKAAPLIIPFLLQSQARAVELELELGPDDIGLVLLRLRVLRGEIAFDELRGWFASRLRPAR
jgi:hypothetical protein